MTRRERRAIRGWTLHGLVDGFVVYSQVLDEMTVHNIAVREEARGKGAGTTLLKGLLVQARATGVNRCLLEVRESNVAARRLYQKTGFVVDGERPNYYPAPAGRENAVLMSKRL